MTTLVKGTTKIQQTPQVLLRVLEKIKVKTKQKRPRMCRAKQSWSSVATPTNDPLFSEFQFRPVRGSDILLNCVESLSKRQTALWLESLPSLSMRFQGKPHFFRVHHFNSLMMRWRDTSVSLEYVHFYPEDYSSGSVSFE